MDFSKYAIISEVTHNFEKIPDWYWIIRPTTAKDEIEMSRFFQRKRYADYSGERELVNLTWLEVAIHEIALCFGGTNIPVSETDTTPILKKGDDVGKIENILMDMPVDLISEIWKAVGTANPLWGPREPQAE